MSQKHQAFSFEHFTCVYNISKSVQGVVLTMRFPAKTKRLNYGIRSVAKLLEEEVPCKVSSNKYMNKDNEDLKN